MIGDILRAEREKQNLTIGDVEKETSIRTLYIEAIENGEYDKLPGEVYLKGFVRNYANFLKLDANAILQQYMKDAHPEQAAAAATAVQDDEPVQRNSMQAPARSEESFHMEDDFKTRVKESRRSQGSKSIFLGILAVVCVLGGAYFFFSGDSPSDATGKPPVKPQQTQQASNSASEQKFDDVELSAKFSDRCWTKVEADGKTVFEGTIEKGKSMSWKAQDKIQLTAGNANAVQVTYNGKDMGTLGAKGQVAEKIYTKDQVEDAK